MDARLIHMTTLAAALLSMGAGYRTQNFIVEAPTRELAVEIGKAAEHCRSELAQEWLGKKMPPWTQPCMLTARVAPNLGAGGATSFVFERGEVFGWRMNIQGSRERILDSVLPHEVTHTVFACHFRRPLPRWADEGACTTVEHSSERAKQQRMLISFLQTNRGISFTRMFAMKEYPADVMPLYSQGFSLARFLISQGGKRTFLEFLADGMEDERWGRAVKKFYGFDTMLALQNGWLGWVRDGSPKIRKPSGDTKLAAAGGGRRARPASNVIYRGQSEDPPQSPASRPATRLASHQQRASGEWKPAAGDSAPASKPEQDSVYRPAPPASPPPHQRQVLLEWSQTSGAPVSSAPASMASG